MIAGKRTAGPVGAAQSRGEPDDQESRRGVAKRCDRSVGPARESAPIGGAEGGQTGAELAIGGRRTGPPVHGAARMPTVYRSGVLEEATGTRIPGGGLVVLLVLLVVDGDRGAVFARDVR
jgi:hypothetical protein